MKGRSASKERDKKLGEIVVTIGHNLKCARKAKIGEQQNPEFVGGHDACESNN